MRVSIVCQDGLVVVDGIAFSGLDLSFMPNNIHAVQWYHTEGEVEYRDAQGRATHTQTITDLIPYHFVLELWQQAKAAAASAALSEEGIQNPTSPG
jgi:hypothetical protein